MPAKKTKSTRDKSNLPEMPAKKKKKLSPHAAKKKRGDNSAKKKKLSPHETSLICLQSYPPSPSLLHAET